VNGFSTGSTKCSFYDFSMKPIELIIAADEPALFFSSIKSAEGYLEATDVEDGIYTAAFGPNGESYQINAKENRVVITPSPQNAAKAFEL